MFGGGCCRASPVGIMTSTRRFFARASSSAEFRSSSTPDNSELMNCLAKWAGIRKPADTKMLVAAVAGSGASPAPMILGWNYGEPATLLRQAYAATRKILIGQTAGSIS